VSALEKSEPADPPAVAAAYYPELVLCLCAAVGTDTTVVSEALASELRAVAYEPVIIRLSSLMAQIPGLEELSKITAEDERIRESMKAGNEIRRIIGHADAVVRLALSTIHSTRENCSGDITVPAERHCFILSSLSAKKSLRLSRCFSGNAFYWSPCTNQKISELKIFVERSQAAKTLRIRTRIKALLRN
jgi:hypothetical protein